MDTAILRSKILDLAIHGQLVPQDSAEGSALDLLEAISKERGQKITPVTNGVPFDLPESWCWVKLGDVLRKMKSRRPDGETFLYVDIDSIDNKSCKIRCPKVIKTSEAPSRASRYTQRGDVLFSMVRPYLRNIALVDGDNYIASTGFYVCSPINIDSLFLYYFMTSTFLVDGLNFFMRGDNSPSIKTNHLEDFLFPLPPLVEQKRIVSKVDELLAAVDSIDDAQSDISNAASILQLRILDLAIHGVLVPQNDADGSAIDLLQSISLERAFCIKGKKKNTPIQPIVNDVPFSIPDNWCWVRLDDLGQYRKGPFGSSLTKAMFVPEGPDTYKVYEQKNAIQKDASLGHYFITKEKYDSMQSFIVQPDDIIISCAGTIGETYIIPKDAKPGIINQALMRVQLYDKSITDFWLLYFESVLQKESQDHGKGTAMKNIPPFDVFKQLPFPLPPLAEQKRIVARVRELLAAIEKLK